MNSPVDTLKVRMERAAAVAQHASDEGWHEPQSSPVLGECAAVLRAAIAALTGGEAVACETCGGIGTIDETLGGEHFSNPEAKCPDCHGRGEIAVTTPRAASGMEHAARCWLAFCADAEAGTFPTGLLDDAKNLGAGALEFHYIGSASSRPLSELIAEWERDPERKAGLDRARALLTGDGSAQGEPVRDPDKLPATTGQVPEGDDKVLWGIVANAGRLSDSQRPRWAHVMDATGLGSTRSVELCKRFGFDPEEATPPANTQGEG